MVAPKLYYFPMKGRSFAIRMAMEHAKMPYEFVPVSHEQFAADRQKYPMGQLPVMEIDGKMLCQTTALMSYIGGKTGLTPADAMEQIKVTEIQGCLHDLVNQLVPSMTEQDAGKKAEMRKALIDPMSNSFNKIEKIVSGCSKKEGCCVGAKRTTVDFELYALVSWIQEGGIDHLPKDMVNAKNHPTLTKVCEGVAGDPNLQTLFDSYKKK
eukprot:GHVN01060565.1.p1 GENE.GHVN01060565.1~~GHVN01060565.1.p1  ORF type:complete len:230 (-),score=49.69 GHVN01060565.1:154-783(-)